MSETLKNSANIIEVRGYRPKTGTDTFLAPGAYLIGDVIAGNSCSFWFHSIVRGDVNAIRIGDKVNIQDGAIVHCTYQKTKTVIGNNVSVGHRALVHGCTIGNNVLIGMGAIVMDGVVIEDNCIIAAGAVVLENTVVKSGSIYAGIPAKKVKDLSEALFSGEVKRIADNYQFYATWFTHVNQL